TAQAGRPPGLEAAAPVTDRASPQPAALPSVRRTAAALFLALLGLFALSTGGHTYSSDEEGMLQQMRAVSAGRYWFELPPDNGVTPVRAGRDGRTTGVSGLGQSVVGLPFYAVGQGAAHLVGAEERDAVMRMFVMFTNSAVTAAIAVVVFLLAAQLGASRRSSVALALIYALGTMAWSHAKTFFSEPLAALLVAVAVLLAFRATEHDRPSLAAWSGLAAGAALLARVSTGLFPPLIGLYLLVVATRRFGLRRGVTAIVAYGAGAVPTLVLFGAANWWRYGSVFDLGYEQVPLNYPLPSGLAGLLLSPGKSIFLYAPVVLVAVLALPVAIRRRPPEVLLLLGASTANVIFFARFPSWHGDHAWGPRYLQIVLPLMVALCAPVLGRLRWRRAVAVAGVVGFGMAGSLGAVLYYNDYLDAAFHSFGGEQVHGEANYLYQLHHVASRSPIVGHAARVNNALSNALGWIDGSDPGLKPYPATINEQYFWFFYPPQLDTWWVWLPAMGVTRWFWLLGVLFAAVSATGWWRLRWVIRHS
ncbi:MAG TPA: hypothetical protein VGL92_16850, partial [Acidimicrobiia bacterium]